MLDKHWESGFQMLVWGSLAQTHPGTERSPFQDLFPDIQSGYVISQDCPGNYSAPDSSHTLPFPQRDPCVPSGQQNRDPLGCLGGSVA